MAICLKNRLYLDRRLLQEPNAVLLLSLLEVGFCFFFFILKFQSKLSKLYKLKNMYFSSQDLDMDRRSMEKLPSIDAREEDAPT